MSEPAKRLDSIPIMSEGKEIFLTIDNLSRLMRRRTGCPRNTCRKLAEDAVFGALSDAKVISARPAFAIDLTKNPPVIGPIEILEV